MKIVIAGNYGANNLGDEMILEGLLKLLNDVVPDAKITVLSSEPKDTKKRHKVKSLNLFPAGFRSFFRNLFDFKRENTKAVKECDVFILGGGGLFGSLTFLGNLIWGLQAKIAYKYHKPVIMYGQSIGELKGKIRKKIVKKIYKKASLIVVRDHQSKKRLEKLKIKEKIYVAPDLALNIEDHHHPHQKNEVVIALRHLEDLSLIFKKGIADFLYDIYDQHDYKIQFIDFKSEVDNKLHEHVIDMLYQQCPVEHITLVKDTHELFRLFSNAGFVLAMRLHSVIAAIMTEKPFIAINYAPKVKAFLEYAKLDEFLIDIDDLSEDKLNEMFKKIMKNKVSIRKRLQNFKAKSLVEHKKMGKLLKKKLEELSK